MLRSLVQPRLGLCLTTLVVTLTTACPGDVPVGGGHSRFDGAPIDLSADARVPDLPIQQPDLDVGRDVLPPDLLLPVDLPPQDLTLSVDTAPPLCSPAVDKDTLVLLTFETSSGSTYPSATGGKRHATVQGGSVTPVLNTLGCGKALRMTAANLAYLEIRHEGAFDLAAGSVDLWVLFDKPGGVGLVSKDASGTNQDGHLTLYRLCDGGIAVRQQHGGQSYHRCTAPVSDKKWMHIAVNFGSGGLKLFVDSQEGTRSGGVACDSSVTCGGTVAESIAANKNPWVIGASSVGSADGVAEPVSAHLEGLIDSVRISKAPRTFVTP